MFALEPGELGPRLRALGAELTGLRAVAVVSAHWQTRGVRVTTAASPPTIHDFGGFPDSLYRLRYPSAGAPALAGLAVQELMAAGFGAHPDAQRGLDHGAWVPLRHLFPEADIPVFQISMPVDLDPVGALRLGAALAPLRDRGVLVVGSGSLTHNLYELRQHVRDPEYAAQFAAWVQAALLAGDTTALADYRHLAPHAVRAHPTEEHYLPLLVAAGAARDGDTAEHISGGMSHGTLSMDSFIWRAARTRDS